MVVSNTPRTYQIFHGGNETFHGGMRYSTEVLKHCTEVSNIPWRGLHIPRGYEVFEVFNYSAEVLKQLQGGITFSTEVSNIPRRR